MHLGALKRNWDALGTEDPLFAILTQPGKANGGWNVDEFFATGVGQMETFLSMAHAAIPALGKGEAMDFGCGVGRLTQPLSGYFDHAYGVDISPSMIDLANKYNRHGDRCRYVLNDNHDLRVFPDNKFDFICSFITLQHMEPRYMREYIPEFIRVLAPGGLLMFQLTDDLLLLKSPVHKLVHRIHHFLQYRVYWRIAHPKRAYFEMHGLPKDEVIQLIHTAGGSILSVDPDRSAGDAWTSFRYCATKP